MFCSALSATIVANLQVEIGSYFRAGNLVSHPAEKSDADNVVGMAWNRLPARFGGHDPLVRSISAGHREERVDALGFVVLPQCATISPSVVATADIFTFQSERCAAQ